MRMEHNEKENMETIRLASKYLGKGVVAADLAGAEALYPTSSFEAVFKEAARKGVPFTIHAGEADGPKSIWEALRFGAKRIGHGVRCLEDEKLVEYLKEKQIPLEVCPTSNFQTRAVKGEYPLKKMLEMGLCATLNTDNTTVSGTEKQIPLEVCPTSNFQTRAVKGEYPLKKMLEMGLCATLNTDNTTVSGTTLEKEFIFAKEQLCLTEEELEQLKKNAEKAKF